MVWEWKQNLNGHWQLVNNNGYIAGSILAGFTHDGDFKGFQPRVSVNLGLEELLCHDWQPTLTKAQQWIKNYYFNNMPSTAKHIYN